MYQEGLHDWGDFSVGWLTGRAAEMIDRTSIELWKTLCLQTKRNSLTWVFPLAECSKSNGRLCRLWFINTMLASSTRPVMNSEQSKGTFQQSTYLFSLALSAEWQWCLVAKQINLWRFPHTCIPQNHKTHLLTLNWHTWEGFLSGEQESTEEECGEKDIVDGKDQQEGRCLENTH